VILRALYDLAHREGLVEDPSYEPRPVSYLVHLGEGGSFLRCTPHFDPPQFDAKGKQKGEPRATVRLVPRRSKRAAQNLAEFLVDKAEYVFGIDPPLGSNAPSAAKAKRLREPEKLAVRRGLFRAAVEQALSSAELANNAGLRATADFLQQEPPAEIRALLSAESAKQQVALSAALFGFVYEPDGGTASVHDDPAVKGYWRALFTDSSGAERGQCLVTGQADVPLARLHAKIKGIPPKSATKGGVPLTSVNNTAFESYGLDAIGCAPISAQASLAVENALNRLLDPAYPGGDGAPLPRRFLAVSPDTVLVYWSREDAGIDFVASLDEADPAQVEAVLHAPYKGRSAAIEDPSAFYALMLSGAQGRGIVRSFVESTVRDVAANVERYLSDARIVKPFAEAAGAFPLLELRRALVPRRDKFKLETLQPRLAVEMYMAILRGQAFPNSILQAVLRRNRAEAGEDVMAFAARASLIKAYLIRNRKEVVTVALDQERPDPPYRLGRLLAALDKVQQEALGSVNASIVDRYYGAASSTPAAVFPTLIRRSQHHAAKLRKEKRGLSVVREKLFQSILASVQVFPRTLNLEEQGLFALGFYHQRQDFYVKKAEEE
jgi:CRISPR-associated protein Csd1